MSLPVKVQVTAHSDAVELVANSLLLEPLQNLRRLHEEVAPRSFAFLLLITSFLVHRENDLSAALLHDVKQVPPAAGRVSRDSDGSASVAHQRLQGPQLRRGAQQDEAVTREINLVDAVDGLLQRLRRISLNAAVISPSLNLTLGVVLRHHLPVQRKASALSMRSTSSFDNSSDKLVLRMQLHGCSQRKLLVSPNKREALVGCLEPCSRCLEYVRARERREHHHSDDMVDVPLPPVLLLVDAFSNSRVSSRLCRLHPYAFGDSSR
mmetsp:Transcript_15015/g.50734  ORF Transcript_15015/g.50734 Transcript_15015/m.50734 type:complete len:265 (-) Transcript_15015:75-869(-)